MPQVFRVFVFSSIVRVYLLTRQQHSIRLCSYERVCTQSMPLRTDDSRDSRHQVSGPPLVLRRLGCVGWHLHQGSIVPAASVLSLPRRMPCLLCFFFVFSHNSTLTTTIHSFYLQTFIV